MGRPTVRILLALVLSLSLISLATARRDGDDSPSPRLVATVTSLSSRGMATIRTADGALYEVIAGTGWRIGDTLECERYDVRGLFDALKLNCRKVS